MKYGYLFFLSLLTGYTYSMDSVQITGFEVDQETITVNKVIVNINSYVENKNHKEAQKWLHRLELLVCADWKFFDGDQIEKYQEVYSELYGKVSSIKSQNKERVSVFQRLDQEVLLKQNESAWLINKLEQDQYNIDWTELLGKSKKSFPSPKPLRKKRIKNLSEIGHVKTMNE